MSDNLVGIAEIATLGNVTKQAITNWRIRYDSFPKPIQTLHSGPVWDRETVVGWIKNFKGEATHVLSFINLKGGVGKTTTAVAVAEILAQEDRKHVLLVDLDPQTNATVTVISEEDWAELDKEGRTIAQLFADRINFLEAPKFDIEKAIKPRVSKINDGIARLDLLPSSIRLIDLQDRVPMIAMQGNFTVNPLEILKKALDPVIDRYDYVIIDCPPSLGTVTSLPRFRPTTCTAELWKTWEPDGWADSVKLERSSNLRCSTIRSRRLLRSRAVPMWMRTSEHSKGSTVWRTIPSGV